MSVTETEIQGTCAAGYEPVRDAFAENFAERDEIGAGLAGLTVPVTAADYEDWEKIMALLAVQEPLWEPGTISGYHAITFGFLVGEVVRRITGQSLGSFFAGEVAGSLGADFHIGLAPATIFGSLVDGSERLISASILRDACTGQGRCTDLVLGIPLEFGLGFGLSGPEHHYGPNPDAFGHDGFGGSAVWADPGTGVAGAYVMNRMGMNLVDDGRRMAVVEGSTGASGAGAEHGPAAVRAQALSMARPRRAGLSWTSSGPVAGPARRIRTRGGGRDRDSAGRA